MFSFTVKWWILSRPLTLVDVLCKLRQFGYLLFDCKDWHVIFSQIWSWWDRGRAARARKTQPNKSPIQSVCQKGSTRCLGKRFWVCEYAFLHALFAVSSNTKEFHWLVLLRRDLNLEFEIPFRELGFSGVPSRSTAFIMPTVNCLVELTEMPFTVITLTGSSTQSCFRMFATVILLRFIIICRSKRG